MITINITNSSGYHYIAFISCIILFIFILIDIKQLFLHNYPYYVAKYNINSHKRERRDIRNIIYYYFFEFLGAIAILSILYLDYIYNLKLSGWISAIGTVSAVLVALFKDDILHPKINIGVNSSPYEKGKHRGYLIIQLLNRSAVTTFMSIDHIYLTNNKNRIFPDKNNDVPIPINNSTLNSLFFPVKAHKIHNIIIFNEIKKENQTLMQFLRRNYKKEHYLILDLQNSRNGKIFSIKVPLKKLFGESSRSRLLQGYKNKRFNNLK